MKAETSVHNKQGKREIGMKKKKTSNKMELIEKQTRNYVHFLWMEIQ